MDEHVDASAVRSAGAKALAAYLAEEIASGRLGAGTKLPAERQLSEHFGASRGAVRRVLQDLKQRGWISQAVGSGTFVRGAPTRPFRTGALPAGIGPYTAEQTSPAELMEARLLIEPLLPRLIVRNATASDFSRMTECLELSEASDSIEEFEHWDGELHQTFALATHNSFFLGVLALANRVREQGEWGRLKVRSLTSERRTQYESQHRAIVQALRDRDADLAAAALADHLRQIQNNLFG